MNRSMPPVRSWSDTSYTCPLSPAVLPMRLSTMRVMSWELSACCSCSVQIAAYAATCPQDSRYGPEGLAFEVLRSMSVSLPSRSRATMSAVPPHRSSSLTITSSECRSVKPSWSHQRRNRS